MRLLVNTLSPLEAFGLVSTFAQYTPMNSYEDCKGVVFDTDTLQCAYVPQNGTPKKVNREIGSAVGVDAIRDILTGVDEIKLWQGSAVVRPEQQLVTLKDTYSLTFSDVDFLYSNIHPQVEVNPGSLVGKIVVFLYNKGGWDVTQRVLVVKEDTKYYLRGLDVLNEFKFKSFKKDKIENLKEVRTS